MHEYYESLLANSAKVVGLLSKLSMVMNKQNQFVVDKLSMSW